MTGTPERAREILQASPVPSLPEALERVLAAANDPATTGETMERHVIRDPGLTLRILKLVNSSFYALPARVTSIRQAVVLVGFPTIRSIASGMVMLEAFGKAEGIRREYLNAVWRHSLLCARLVPLLFRGQRGKPVDDAGFAAMIHDVGHLLLARHFEADYERLLRDSSFPPPELEAERFGIDHVALGAALLAEWRFPADLIALVRGHHSPEPAPDPRPGHALRAADLLAEALAYSPSVLLRPEAELPAELRDSLASLGWSWAELGGRADAVRTVLDSVPDDPEAEA
jgi:HD-like signal output (HDOD) protein